MPKCPNCGQDTARTEDWACQWCGYPLLSASYKKIPQTYKQLKDEKRDNQKSPVTEVTVVPAVPSDSTLAAANTLDYVNEPPPEPEVESTPVMESKPILEPKTKFTPEPKPEPMLMSEPSQAQTAIDVTADELLSAYKEDETAANARFANKILKVTGIVNRIEVKSYLDFSYITLSNAEQNLLQNVRCFFNKKYGSELSQLTKGQRVTVQGEFDGSIINIRMIDCVLVR